MWYLIGFIIFIGLAGSVISICINANDDYDDI